MAHNKLDTTGKSRAMRKFERSTLVITKVDPATLAKPRRDDGLTLAQREQVALTGTYRASA